MSVTGQAGPISLVQAGPPNIDRPFDFIRSSKACYTHERTNSLREDAKTTTGEEDHLPF